MQGNTLSHFSCDELEQHSHILCVGQHKSSEQEGQYNHTGWADPLLHYQQQCWTCKGSHCTSTFIS